MLKKLTVIALLGILINACSAEKITEKVKVDQLLKIAFAYSLVEEKNNEKITKEQYIEKLLKCSEEGNNYCSVFIAEDFLAYNKYEKAYPYLIKAINDKIAPDSDIHSPSAFANYDLGMMYSYGNGVLQNSDKAIEYFSQSVKLGMDRDAYVKISQEYLQKWDEETQGSFNTYTSNAKFSYAWMKLASSKATPKDPAKGNDHKIVNPAERISFFKTLLVYKSHITELNNIASDICSTIPSCIQ